MTLENGKYIQFTKLLAVMLCVIYVTQTAATFVMICIKMDAADPLLALMRDTLWLYGLIYGCYAGNSAVEKVGATKNAVEKS